MKPIKALTPADFPGYDPQKTGEWLGEAKRAAEIMWAFYAVVAGFAVMVLIMYPALLLVAAIMALLVPLLVFRRSRILRHEAGLSTAAVTKARLGELRRREAEQPVQVESPAEEREEVHV